MSEIQTRSEKNIQLLHIFDPRLLSGSHAAIIDLIRNAFLISEDEFGYEIKVRDALSKIWLRLLKICMPAIQEKPQFVNRAADKVKRMMVYIHEHYSEKIFVSELAQDAFISERECYRVFQEYLHMTPVEYIKSYRIQAACQMLADSQTPITEIASDCGWGNASYFGKIFREYTGNTPLQYRRKWQNSEKIWQDNIIS